jgi:hypothetical protein
MARLAGALVDQLTIPVRDTHRAVADRVFSRLGAPGLPVRLAHDGISGVVYTSVRGGARAAGATAGAALALAHGGRERRSVSGHPVGALALAFGSGLLGDWIDERAGDLSVPLALTQHGRPLPAAVEDVPDALADVSGRIVLFVHGLAETTAAWGWWSTDDQGRPVPTYGQRLADVGWTPLELGYNTGRPVAANGSDLSDLLDAVVDAWPVPVDEIALVGHSMGGLVLSAAGHHAVRSGAGWSDRVRHVVTLGTPHRGSWLAKGAAAASRTLATVPESRPLADVIDLRSAGIRDLTHGWRPEADGEVAELARLLPHARHTYVAATLGRRRGHPLTRLVGDGLVHPGSAMAPARCGAVNVEVRVHPGVGHVRLVHHPAVADDLVAQLA